MNKYYKYLKTLDISELKSELNRLKQNKSKDLGRFIDGMLENETGSARDRAVKEYTDLFNKAHEEVRSHINKLIKNKESSNE